MSKSNVSTSMHSSTLVNFLISGILRLRSVSLIPVVSEYNTKVASLDAVRLVILSLSILIILLSLRFDIGPRTLLIKSFLLLICNFIPYYNFNIALNHCLIVVVGSLFFWVNYQT